MRKYPRTRHIMDSRLQPGDEDLDPAGFDEIAGRHVVIEEKVDGANCGFSFTKSGDLRLQSRGHYLSGGPHERQFDRFKAWAREIAMPLFPRLGTRYLVYGEWLHAKHTIFYDALPDFFLEFDVLDLVEDRFLTTQERLVLLSGSQIHSVPVLFEGILSGPERLAPLLGASRYKSPDWRVRLTEAASVPPHRPDMVLAQTDPSDLAEGLYIKDESEGCVSKRLKYVRAGFLQTVTASGSHWQERPILNNRLAGDAKGGEP